MKFCFFFFERFVCLNFCWKKQVSPTWLIFRSARPTPRDSKPRTHLRLENVRRALPKKNASVLDRCTDREREFVLVFAFRVKNFLLWNKLSRKNYRGTNPSVLCAEVESKLKVITDFFLFFFAEKEEEWFLYEEQKNLVQKNPKQSKEEEEIFVNV